MVLNQVAKVGLMLGAGYFTSGFVLLSGPVEARLPVSTVAPTIQFVWNGTAPGITSKDDVEGGIYAGLDDQAFFAFALQTAVTQWNAVRGSYVRLSVVQNAATAKIDEEDRVFSIVTDTEASASTAASARPKTDSDGVIYDCDIQVADRSSTSARSLIFTLVHELGHCLGLGHNHSNYNSIMSYARSQSTYNLGADDKAGLIFLYPDPAYAPEASKEAVGCGVAGRKHSTMGLGWMFFMPLMLILVRRKSY